MAFSFISDLWKKWNIRGFVILSLSLQVFLFLFATLRKKTANRPIILLLWLAYLMADLVAAFAIGLISYNQGSSNAHVAEVDGALRAFWASFLLLHLGGLDIITAFSLEDSSLWQRHLISLTFQVGATIYVFVQIFPSDKSLVIPTILVFLAGFIKIVERILALYLSSFPNLRESMLLDNEVSMVVDSLQWHEEFVDCSNEYVCYDEGAKLDECIIVKHAHFFFQIFKIFIADLIYTKQQRKISSDYFDKVSAMDALRLISVELNFIYEVLHTKALTIHHQWSYIFRIIAFTSIVVALGLFNHLKKYPLLELDVNITYILLFGEISLDGIALFMLVFSDWTIAGIKGSSKLDAFLYNLVSPMNYLRKPRYATCKVDPNTNVTYEVLDTPLIFRRWSESMSACNFFSEALKESPRKMYKCNQLKGIVICKIICSFPSQMIDKLISCFLQGGQTIARCFGKRLMIANAKYVSKNLFIKKLWVFIFHEVRRSSKKLHGKEMVTQLVNSNQSFPGRMPSDLNDILYCVNRTNMHSYILMWHIATEIWYNKEKQSMSSTTTLDLDRDLVDRKEFSKILSDYMLYLLLNQPNLMSAVAMVSVAQMVSAKTLRELRNLIGDATTDPNEICEKLYNRVQGGMPSRARAAGRPTNPLKSPLYEGLLLARELEDRGESKWNYVSSAWIGLLSYAAVNIKGEAHVKMLSKGGELLTFVWLLMAHLGCFSKPEWGLYREYWEERSEDDSDDSDASVVNNEYSA